MIIKSNYKCYRCKEIKPAGDFYPNRNHASRPVSANCKPCSSKTTSAWQKEHPEVVDAWKERNPDYHPDWRENNREAVRHSRRVSFRKYRARKYSAKIVEAIDLDTLYKRDDGICGICAKYVLREHASHDHIIPLSKGGDHSWANAQLAHRACNSKKKDKIICVAIMQVDSNMVAKGAT